MYYYVILYPVIKCEWSNRKVADLRGKLLEQILQQKWCPSCRRGIRRLYLSYQISKCDKRDGDESI